uniref:Uncharacterized protein n=1 Tax=Candidatus Kentrum sp. SD TaxID=2126332 RepID=A0A450YP44_9GAMM|nr:MAG: hypothetical protein BECKSD772F_GA0070984_11414 [Candidatus Kentron sp. SD]VFK48718.1 MAG: hypothetical protein BECKSD772E_GA0070983_11384 [Candidatus Kentron sp. SD]
MDENEYRSLYHAVNPFACPFEKAVLARHCGCEHLRYIHIAEREGAGCKGPLARETCLEFLDLLRRNARFALRLVDTSTAPLPHAREIKAQVGGLRGLARALRAADRAATLTMPDTMAPEDQSPENVIENVHALLRDAMEAYGDMNALPYGEIVKEITRFEGRSRRGRKGKSGH